MTRTKQRNSKGPKTTIKGSDQTSAPPESHSAWNGLPTFVSREHWKLDGNPFDQIAAAKSFGVARITPLEHWSNLQSTILLLTIGRWCAKCLGRTDVEMVLSELFAGKLRRQKFRLPERVEDFYLPGEEQVLQDIERHIIASSFHPVSNLFPPCSIEEMQQLVTDIQKKEGLHLPIYLHPKTGLVMDGRHRFIACVIARVKPEFKDWDGKGSALAFAVSLNLKRRDLTKGQRAAIAVGLLPMLEKEARQRQISNLKQNRSVPETIPERGHQIVGEARDLAAAMVGVNARYVSDAKKIQEEAPEIFARLYSREISSVPKAKLEVELDIREKKRESNRELLKTVPSLEVFELDVKFSTILADPPWNYMGKRSTMAPDYHTESLQNIKNLPVANKAADDCHLYLWVPNGLLMSMPELLEAWGFRYVSILTWHKRGEKGHKARGCGRRYFRNTTEQVIFAVRGSQPTKTHKIETFFEFRSGKGHSSKPEEFITQVVEPCSHGPYLELFGRKERPGWKVWGETAAKLLRKTGSGKRRRAKD